MVLKALTFVLFQPVQPALIILDWLTMLLKTDKPIWRSPVVPKLRYRKLDLQELPLCAPCPAVMMIHERHRVRLIKIVTALFWAKDPALCSWKNMNALKNAAPVSTAKLLAMDFQQMPII